MTDQPSSYQPMWGTSQGQLQNEVAGTPRTKDNPYDIEIKSLDYGYQVKVGCKYFAFETSEAMLKKLNEYLVAPAETEKKFYEKTLFKTN